MRRGTPTPTTRATQREQVQTDVISVSDQNKRCANTQMNDRQRNILGFTPTQYTTMLDIDRAMEGLARAVHTGKKQPLETVAADLAFPRTAKYKMENLCDEAKDLAKKHAKGDRAAELQRSRQECCAA